MKQKIIASFIVCVFVCVFMCSCAKKTENSSSTAAKPEKNSSTITTISENAGVRGLKFHLAVEQDGYSIDAYKIHPETPKWIDYSTRLRQIVKDYNSEKANILRKP